MARKLNKAKKQEGSLLSRQREKLESQRRDAETARRDANVAQYEKEKAARSKKKYSSDVNPYFNPRSVREEVLSYLLDEGFASDEKSAEAIMCAMSEAWVESICESLIGDFESKQRQQSGYKGPAGSVKTTPGYKSPIETRNDIKPETRHLFLQAKNKSSNGTQTA
jgi:hypothetical protein